MLGSWVEVEAPANIALIKYWGKRDEDLILPLNDSVSLSVNYLCARTRIELVEEEDSVSINGKSVEKITGSRFEKCFEEACRLLRAKDSKINFSFKVTSTTTFPVAAGLASSAAGFAAIAFGLGKLLDFTETEYSRIARIGSGSACRSVGEGLVHWHAGSDPKGEDCYSESLFHESHWPELRSVILVFNEQEKETGSTVGMRTTVETSSLLQHRVSHVVPKRVKDLITAFKDRNFPALAEITMTDSNQFHAVCMDTFPPLRYMTDSSWEVISLVNKFNEDGIKAAYSFDAGPNACVFMEERNLPIFLGKVLSSFSVTSTITGTVTLPKLKTPSATTGPEIKQIICSHVGMGPRLLSTST